jgi:hypothetical protein
MRQAILGVSIFLGLQIVYVLVLFGLTLWERRQLNRPVGRPRSIPKAARAPMPVPVPSDDEDLPLSA